MLLCSPTRGVSVMSDRTTARARRQRAVREGREPDGVDRLSPRSNPGGRGSEPPGRTRQQDRRREIADELDILRLDEIRFGGELIA